ncbi:complement C1q-like protein 3 [Mya arenaria]|uniref:complement C1q-like protein 3 n=1 Tax=Mya arenaria TaxID=6604 RepID=UPI0022E6E44C|nr:complement C1q-like protein 3 [Mya arenaria]
MAVYVLMLVVLAVRQCTSSGVTLDTVVAEIVAMKNERLEDAARMEHMEKELTNTKKRLAELEALKDPRTHQARQTHGHSPVAFQAYLSQGTGVGLHQVIPFNVATLNVGNAFNPTTHTFTCPVNGLYVFQSALTSQNGQMAQGQIMIAGMEGPNIYAAGASNGHGFDQGFNSLVTVCRKGDTVWVRNYHDQSRDMFTLKYTSFSGYLLEQVTVVTP